VEPIVIVAIVAIVIVAIVIGMVVASRRRPSAPSPQARSASAPPTAPPRALRDRLARSRSALTAALGGVFGSAALDDSVWGDIEDALISADVGPAATAEVVTAVRAAGPETGDQARVALEAELTSLLERDDRSLRMASRPSVLVVVGVNGTGKTTSIAKIAKHLTDDGRTVVLGAADTYRAAADSQLRAWGDRVGVPVVSGDQGSDPASVAFDAYTRARTDGADVVIVDTAGRLHSQANLMDELRKVVRVLDRESGGVDEVLLVLDGTVGQNGIAQARSFTDAVGVTGVILTKLDGTARGGVAIAIETQLDVPVKLIGVGEGMDDLIPFVPSDFVEALLDE
jgi:fused signal recognition particle receptor